MVRLLGASRLFGRGADVAIDAGRLFLKRRRPFGFAPFADVLEGFASLGEDRRLAGKILPTADRGVAIVAVYFDRPGAPALRYAMRPEPMCSSLDPWSLASRKMPRGTRGGRVGRDVETLRIGIRSEKSV
jgi:hypothetical protein